LTHLIAVCRYGAGCVCVFFCLNSSVAALTYTIRDVGPASVVYDESIRDYVIDLNDNGLVTGWIRSLTATNPIDEGPIVNQKDSVAYAVNNVNEIVGWSQGADGIKAATMWIQNEFGLWEALLLDTGVGNSVAHDLNDSGVVVGETEIDGVRTAVIWDEQNGTQVITIPGAISSVAYGVSRQNIVVGEYYLSGNKMSRGFIWDEVSGFISLGGLGGDESASWVSDINNDDIVVGGSATPKLCNGWGACFSVYHGFQWDAANAMLDLSLGQGMTTTWATGVNDAGVIVGAQYQYPESIAVIWADGEMSYLDDLIPAEIKGWYLIEAASINTHGQIVGRGTLNGEQRIFLLTPDVAPAIPTVIPTPTTMPVNPPVVEQQENNPAQENVATESSLVGGRAQSISQEEGIDSIVEKTKNASNVETESSGGGINIFMLLGVIICLIRLPKGKRAGLWV